MFFKLIWQNVSKNRKENGLFFGSLVISIIAFYTLLSLKEQDVMGFLNTIESEAISKLMILVPVVYVISLFFVFFLVYFACRYQMDNRRKEFGLYLMLGMKRSRLFAILMFETIWNSVISILIGLPLALFLTETTSLATAKLVGLGIIGHKFSFSSQALLWTIIGFFAIQIVSMLLIFFRYSKTEPAQFMQSDSSETQKPISMNTSVVFFILGIAFLVIAYTIGILFLRNIDLMILLVLAFGAIGTFMLYRGMGGFIGSRIRRKNPDSSGLYTFTSRQIQENVFHQHKTLAVSSLLLLVALSSLAFGIGTAAGRGSAESRTADFSIVGTESEISTILNSEKTKAMIETYYPMYLSQMKSELNSKDLSLNGLITALEKLPRSDMRDSIINNLPNSSKYVISEASYNQLLTSMDKEPIHLAENQIALYSMMTSVGNLYKILDDALKSGAYIEMDGERYELLPKLFYDKIVADRSITLYAAFIVPDELYQTWATDIGEPFCWNVRLDKSLTDDIGLMQAIQKMEVNLSTSGLEYESYLSGIGRNLFYTIASSYLTIYLGVLFLIISNTVIGLKYLIQQRKNKHRYITLLMLGAQADELCDSSKKQIQIFFIMVLSVALCNAVFAIWAMFTGYLKLPAGSSIITVSIFSAVALILFGLLEIVYMNLVKRTSCREIQALRVTDRR